RCTWERSRERRRHYRRGPGSWHASRWRWSGRCYSGSSRAARCSSPTRPSARCASDLQRRGGAPCPGSRARNALPWYVPPMRDTKRRLLWHGIVMVLLALLGGAFVQALANPRLGLSAHVGGVMNGTLVAVVGAVWGELALPPRAARLLFWSALYSGYVN